MHSSLKEVRRVGSACVWLVSFQKGDIWRQAHAENTMWRWSQRPGWCFYRPRNTKDCQPSTRRGGWQEQSPPHSLQKEPTLSTPWSQTTNLQNCEAIHPCQFSHVVLRALLRQETNREPCSVKLVAVGLTDQSARSGTWHRQQIHVYDEHRKYHIVWI